MRQLQSQTGGHLFLGVVHLKPLPGAPLYGGRMREVVDAAMADAAALAEGGADGWIVENFGDAPFYPDQTPPETATAMTAVATQLRDAFPEHLIGVNILRNDARAALAVAAAADCDFIRVNILNSARLCDQGLIQGRAHEVLRYRKQLDAEQIQILADVDVKHSAPLVEQPLDGQVKELLERGGADALVVSGEGTGMPTSVAHVQAVRAAAPHGHVLVGSGVTLESIDQLADAATGYIVGTSLKERGDVHSPVCATRVAKLAGAIRR